MWEITLLEPVETWFLKLCEDDPESANRVTNALDFLAQEGPNLGRPMSTGFMAVDCTTSRSCVQVRAGTRRCACCLYLTLSVRRSFLWRVTSPAAGPTGIATASPSPN